ncbi:hypothetical protein PUR_30700 [Paenibacillus sp. URB8-2]|nr:hypothetical protein PUR_30700 [Paenibacillus sp. URB8-2]
MGILREFLAIVQNSRGNKHAEVTDKCLGYIETHFSEDISLEHAANLLFFSPNYLSIIFKSRLGVSFTKYLSDCRQGRI